jgi:hypothetical protein
MSCVILRQARLVQRQHHVLRRCPVAPTDQRPDDVVQTEQRLVACHEVVIEHTAIAADPQREERKMGYPERARALHGRRRQHALKQSFGRRKHVLMARFVASERCRSCDTPRREPHALTGQREPARSACGGGPGRSDTLADSPAKATDAPMTRARSHSPGRGSRPRLPAAREPAAFAAMSSQHGVTILQPQLDPMPQWTRPRCS